MKNFFSDLHKSIFDPGFHGDAVKRSRRSIFLFVLTLLVVTSLISGIAKAYYLAHPQRGIAPTVCALFADAQITEGRLSAGREVPYELQGKLVSSVMNRLAGQPNFFGAAPENFLVVDTRGDGEAGYPAGGEPKVLFGETAIRFADVGISIPYEALVGKEFKISEQSVRNFLTGIAIQLAFHFVTMSFFFGAVTAGISIIFLAAAARIFSMERDKKYWYFIRLASFSITPVLLGSALVAVTGVEAGWTWHVFVIISTVIMYRAAARSVLDKSAGYTG